MVAASRDFQHRFSTSANQTGLRADTFGLLMSKNDAENIAAQQLTFYVKVVIQTLASAPASGECTCLSTGSLGSK